MADKAVVLENLSRAYDRLVEFAALPIAHQRDQAGVIQAFEFTFELFWKTFQKLAPEFGLRAESPREALRAGMQMGYIAYEQEAVWGSMLKDRNLMSHIYREDVAQEVFSRVVQKYLPVFGQTLERLRAGRK